MADYIPRQNTNINERGILPRLPELMGIFDNPRFRIFLIILSAVIVTILTISVANKFIGNLWTQGMLYELLGLVLVIIAVNLILKKSQLEVIKKIAVPAICAAVAYILLDSSFGIKNLISLKEDLRSDFTQYAIEHKSTYARVIKSGPVYFLKSLETGKDFYTNREIVQAPLLEGSKVMVLDNYEYTKNYSGEPMTWIMISNEHGDFVPGNKIFLFPRSRLSDTFAQTEEKNVKSPYPIIKNTANGQGIFIKPSNVPEVIGRVRNGDVIKYSSPQSFMVIYDPNTNSAYSEFHNKSTTLGEIRCFEIYGAPKEGNAFAIIPIGTEQGFEMDYFEIIRKS